MFARSHRRGAYGLGEGDRQGGAIAETIRLFPREVGEAEIHAYVDNCLSRLERLRVEAYLARHPRQAERVDFYRAQNTGLHELFDLSSDWTPARLRNLAERFSRSIAWASRVRIILWSTIAISLAMLGLAGAWTYN